MYFPFLYGRRSEFLALRAMLADHRSLESLVPVIEPVNLKPDDLLRCLDAYGKAKNRIAVIINPDKHQLNDRATVKAWRAAVEPRLNSDEVLIPAYRCHAQSNQSNLDAFFKMFPEGDTAIVYASPGLGDSELKSLAGSARVKFHIVLNGKIPSAQRAMLPKNKFVEIQDDFNKLDRNADYSGPEFFTDRHKTFHANGVGFGDYTSVGSVFRDGGSTPHAVAMHAIYRNKSTQDIWVEHFVSDDVVKEVGDVGGKYLQAVKKLVSAAKKRPSEFGANFALDAYASHVKSSEYPGLGKNKELQIDHHICLMLDVLSGSL